MQAACHGTAGGKAGRNAFISTDSQRRWPDIYGQARCGALNLSPEIEFFNTQRCAEPLG